MARVTPAEVDPHRSDVERAYGAAIPDVTWEWLKEYAYVEELEAGDLSPEDVASKIREINGVAPVAVARFGRRFRPADPGPIVEAINKRLNSLAESIALRAAVNSGVERWRHRWLNDQLIAPDAVTDWIDSIYKRYLPKDWPTDVGPADATNFPGKFGLWPKKHGRLQWINRGDSTLKVWCVPPRGPLAELSSLVEKLTYNWDWHPAHASVFVLTGVTPPRPGVRGISFQHRRGFDRCYGPYDLLWVEASIDVEVTPEELAAWWRGVRSERGISGRKPIGEKSAALALYAMSRGDDTTLREDMAGWNASVEEAWRFSDWRNYRSAAFNAIRALNRPAEHCTI